MVILHNKHLKTVSSPSGNDCSCFSCWKLYCFDTHLFIFIHQSFCDKLYRRFCKTDAAAKALEPCLSFWVDCSGRLKPFGNLGSLLDLLRLILSPLDFWLVVWNIFSRMRSKGSRFTLGVWGLRVCSLEVAFTVATVHNRPQPFATVRFVSRGRRGTS